MSWDAGAGRWGFGVGSDAAPLSVAIDDYIDTLRRECIVQCLSRRLQQLRFTSAVAFVVRL